MRQCLPILVAYAFMFAGYSYGFTRVFGTKESLIGGLVCGFLSLCFTGALLQVWSDRRKRRRLRDARMGVMPQDGWRVAAVGEIQPTEQAVVAPFSHTSCVLCSYSIKSERASDDDANSDGSNSRHFAVDLTGYLMNPCTIRGATESIGLYAFPVLEGFSDDVRRLPSQIRNGWEFATSTEFEDHSGARKWGAFTALTQALSEHDGQVASHLRLGKSPDELFAASFGYMELSDDVVARDLEDDDFDDDDVEVEDDSDAGDSGASGSGAAGDDASDSDDGDDRSRSTGLPQLIETLVEPGTPVCAFGVYSAQRGGLVPGMVGSIQVIRGTVEQVDADLAKKVSYNLRLGLIGHLILHGAIALVITVALLNAPAAN